MQFGNVGRGTVLGRQQAIRIWSSSESTEALVGFDVSGPGAAVFDLPAFQPPVDVLPGIAEITTVNVALDNAAPIGHYEALLAVDAETGPPLLYELRANVTPDLNGDGQFTAGDVDLLSDAVAMGDGNPIYDLTGEGQVTDLDRDFLLSYLNRSNGDADFSGMVQFPDFLRLASNFGQTGKTWSEGDLDSDGEVQFSDFAILAANYSTAQAGLRHAWYSADGIDGFEPAMKTIQSSNPDIPPFHPERTWWTGNLDSHLPRGTVEGLPQYPRQLTGKPRSDGEVWDEQNNNDYLVLLTGEIFIPEPGRYRFTDGIDDVTVFGIDLNRDASISPRDREVLISDNDWTNITRERNEGGGGMVAVDFADLAAGGEWFRVEVLVAERGGDDAGIIFWDYDVGDRDADGQRIGDASGFPSSVAGEGRIIPVSALPHLAIPDSRLRSLDGQGSILRLEFSPEDFDFSGNVTSADANLLCDRLRRGRRTGDDALLDLTADGVIDHADLSAFLLAAGSLSGDADLNGVVEFSDFLSLADRTARQRSWEQGDFDCNRRTDFDDFVLLANNFGSMSAEVAAVPEPSTGVLCLVTVAMMVLVLRKSDRFRESYTSTNVPHSTACTCTYPTMRNAGGTRTGRQLDLLELCRARLKMTETHSSLTPSVRTNDPSRDQGVFTWAVVARNGRHEVDETRQYSNVKRQPVK